MAKREGTPGDTFEKGRLLLCRLVPDKPQVLGRTAVSTLSAFRSAFHALPHRANHIPSQIGHLPTGIQYTGVAANAIPRVVHLAPAVSSPARAGQPPLSRGLETSAARGTAPVRQQPTRSSVAGGRHRPPDKTGRALGPARRAPRTPHLPPPCSSRAPCRCCC